MEQISGFLKRFQVPRAVGERAKEYYRLAEVKCAGGSIRGGLPPSALAVICIEIACSQLGEPLDKKQAQRLSGLAQKAYSSGYQTVEKLLSISSRVTTKELAVRLGYLEADELASEILQRYESSLESKYTAAQKEALDLTEPLYPAAALYTACKLLKVRCDKKKFQDAASGSRSMFQAVLEEMNKSAPKDIEEFKSGRSQKKRSRLEAQQPDEEAEDHEVQRLPRPSKKSKREPLQSRIQSNPLSKEYLAWKERILCEARAKLNQAD